MSTPGFTRVAGGGALQGISPGRIGGARRALCLCFLQDRICPVALCLCTLRVPFSTSVLGSGRTARAAQECPPTAPGRRPTRPPSLSTSAALPHMLEGCPRGHTLGLCPCAMLRSWCCVARSALVSLARLPAAVAPPSRPLLTQTEGRPRPPAAVLAPVCRRSRPGRPTANTARPPPPSRPRAALHCGRPVTLQCLTFLL